MGVAGKLMDIFIHQSLIAFLEAFIDPNPPSYLGRFFWGFLKSPSKRKSPSQKINPTEATGI